MFLSEERGRVRAEPRRRRRQRLRAVARRYGRFMQPDPLGYEAGTNLYAYVGNDPVNFTDPLGLDADLNCEGGTCSDIVIGGGSRPSLRGIFVGSGSVGRFFLSTVIEDSGAGVALAKIGDALDNFAEKRLKPPEARRKKESFEECMARIAGDTPALGVVGAFSIAAGGPWLGYFRGGLGGGGRGSSLISYAARGALGDRPVGRQFFGTGNIGGIAGRGLSKFSVASGAAAIGWSAGKSLGAVKKCQ